MAKKTKAKKNAPTELVCVIDRSGSMSATLADAQGGLDTFLAKQKALGEPCNLTLHEFDTEFDTPIPHGPIADAPAYRLVPRGMTALYDAVGRTIRDLDAHVAKGAQVIVLIVTDGQENSSREFTGAQVRELVKARTDAGWAFSFVGVGIDAYADGGTMGMARASTISAVNYTGSFAVMDSAVSRTRTTGENYSYTDDEKAKAEDA